MKAYLVQIQCITNMHVGNGDVNYNIIDNEVERDPVTNYPMINASGVKGALREYFKDKVSAEELGLFFGKGAEVIDGQGKVKILGADMVAIPARATGGNRPYYLVSTQTAIDRINQLAETFIVKKPCTDSMDSATSAEAKADGKAGAEVEGFKLDKLYHFNSYKVYIMEEADFRMIELPVLARNKLNNGKSESLWYEEIVPHDSIFVFPIVAENEDILKDFIKVIEGKVVQFGGNASIGYGLCKVTVYR